jgi:hypothetical protein
MYSLETDGYHVREVFVQGNPGELYLSEDPAKNNSLIWCDEEKQVVFCLSGLFSREELLQIGESVTAGAKK